MNTNRTLIEIEVALAKHDAFNYVRNIVAYNVNGVGSQLLIGHECDMLVLSKSGYLTEIEIKRSWADFVADFKKDHSHDGRGLIKYFYYCVPVALLERCYEKLEQTGTDYSGIITYDENLEIHVYGRQFTLHDGGEYHYGHRELPHRKLFIEEQLQVARFGAMRAIGLKEKLIRYETNP